MKVLITGGAGFIGSNLARHLLANDPAGEVRIIDDLSTGRLENLDGLNVNFTEDSILNSEALADVAKGVDSVIHLAAIGSVPRSVKAPMPSHDANATGTLNVLETARALGVDHVVVASSSSVYGSNPTLPKSETDWTRPMSPYGVSKLATEGYAVAYGHSYGMRTLAFRFFNVFGPGQRADHDYAAVIPRFLDAALNGRPVTVYGDGTQSRDFTYVESVCAALFAAATRRVGSESPMNLAFGTNTTLLELIALMGEQLGSEVAIEFSDPRAGDIRASQADGSLLRRTFPEISPTKLEDGLEQTIAWFKSGA